MGKTARQYLEDEMNAAQDRANALRRELADVPDPVSAVATAPDAGNEGWLDELYEFETKVETFIEDHKSTWVPEAESWLKLHSVQAFIVISLCAVAVIFLPTLVTLVQFALFVLAACVVGIFLRLAKQKGLAGAEEMVVQWVQEHTTSVVNVFGVLDARIKSLEAFMKAFVGAKVDPTDKTEVKIMPFGRSMTDFKEDPANPQK